MRCQWQAFINLLPHWMRHEVDKIGQDCLEELRIRIGYPPEMILHKGNYILSRSATKDDIAFVINTASEYSPWAAGTIQRGFITAPGGHRIGICGSATVNGKKMTGISFPTSLCMRVARDFEGISQNIGDIKSSLLIIGPPGSGKTTLLRDLIRHKSNKGNGFISVIDEREEIFPLYKRQACFQAGKHTDILSGCSKAEGIDAMLRSMNPEWIAVDEITCSEDSEALLQAGWCGVQLLATAHAGSLQDFITRPVYKPLVDYKLFTHIIVLQRDKSWRIERI